MSQDLNQEAPAPASPPLLEWFHRKWREKIPQPGHKRFNGVNRKNRRARYSVKRFTDCRHITVEVRKTHPITGAEFKGGARECILHATKGWRIRAL